MNYSQVTVDILQNPKYAGAIDSVSWLTNWIDSGFGMVITIVAFLIILVAMFKNVLAAAYCAYPKFWDRVDAAHKEVESMGWIQQFKDTFITKDVNSGSFSNAIMRILPNIKSFTDFEGDTVRPKTYFIRAIPQMILCIIIGAFIYNGYYRDLAAKVVDFGSEMVSRVLLEVDPIAVFDQFTGSAGRPVFASDNSEIPEQQLVNKIATNTYNAVIGEYNDISGADAKRALADTIEGKIQTWVDELAAKDATYIDGVSWKSVLQVTITNGVVDISQINGVFNKDGTVAQYALLFPISDLSLSSNINVGLPMYVRIRLNFEKQAVQSGSHSVTGIELHVTGLETVSLPKGSALYIKGASTTFTINGVESGKVTYDLPNETLKIEYNSGVSRSNGTVLTLSNALQLIDNKTGAKHTITSIVIGESSNYLYTAAEGKFDFNKADLGVVVKGSTGETPTESTTPEG